MKLDLAPRKRIGLVAHDNKKQDLIEWARYNRGMLEAHDLVATGTTGLMLQRELDLPVHLLQSGPLGGDLQVGAMIADGTHRLPGLLLGSAGAPASRHGRQVAAADRGRVEHPGRVRPRLGRLHDLLAAHDRHLRAARAGLHGPQRARRPPGRRRPRGRRTQRRIWPAPGWRTGVGCTRRPPRLAGCRRGARCPEQSACTCTSFRSSA